MEIRASQCKLVLSVPILLLCSSCGPEAVTSAPAAIPVKVGGVRPVQRAETVALSGSIESPGDPAELSFLVAGKVANVGPREGDLVRKGQVLAALDPLDYRLALEASAAQSRMAHAALDKADRPARPEVLEQARLAFQRTEDEYQRMKKLYDSKSLPPNDFRKFETAYLAAKEQYEQAKTGAAKEDKAQARAALEQAEAAEGISAKRLSDTKLLSPMDGFVSKRLVEPGNTASPGRPVFLIVRLDPVEVRVGVPESDLSRVRVGQRTKVQVPALPGETFEGTVRLINVSADPSTRTYMTRITVPNPAHRLRLGMVAETAIQSDRETTVMTLPGEAIVRDPQGATLVYVYYPDKKRVYSRRVEAGSVYGQEVQIKSGLAGDESVVLGGQQMLRDGVSVDAQAAGARP